MCVANIEKLVAKSKIILYFLVYLYDKKLFLKCMVFSSFEEKLLNTSKHSSFAKKVIES